MVKFECWIYLLYHFHVIEIIYGLCKYKSHNKYQIYGLPSTNVAVLYINPAIYHGYPAKRALPAMLTHGR